MIDRDLTLKQQLFVDSYLGDARGNGAEAAKLAGYAGDAETLRAIAYENLTKPHVASHIRAYLAARGATTDVIVAELLKVALEPLETFLAAGRESKATLGDKVHALELLGKHLRMFVERTETSATEHKRIEIVSIRVADDTIDGTARELGPPV